ncbi:ABC transporter ATP-binding protein [Demequina lutea]|uniref:Putative ABC transport system ATP-binding protein n=1 Tax=Demequina lutea TaxID=431489 RepID=A0A7Y9ZAD5_9MICO|nr:ABC transporter ATP-binding protein [Demequina lutea]NYI41752.1 putative ABC transport system ATP-binding protein [Demequina lutea]
MTTHDATSTTTAGISMTGVTLELGDGDRTVRALDSVDLRVGAGEFLAIVGPSGAGKSSLLAIAGALAAPTSGSVRVHGQDLASLSRRAQARFRLHEIGFVFQSGNLVPALTVADQLRLVHRLAGGRTFDPTSLLEQVGMAHKANRRPHELSGGERQRVGIARALVNSPSLLLVDEPTSSLDRQRSQDIVGLLSEETHLSSVATVMVTHDHDVLHHCDRVLTMEDGRLDPESPIVTAR